VVELGDCVINVHARGYCDACWQNLHSDACIFVVTIYLLTAVRLSPGGSTHLHTNNTWNNTNNSRTTQIQTNVEECGPCPVFASFTLAFALQLRKKHGKTSVKLRKPQSKYSIHITKNTHTLQSPHKHTHCCCCH